MSARGAQLNRQVPMQALLLRLAGLVVLLAPVASGAEPKDLFCEPQKDSTYWVEFMRISPSAGIVLLKLRQDPAPQKVPLLYVGPEQSGQPIFAFNQALDGPRDEVFNAFKLFRVGKEWLLISAGLEPRGETISLRAIGKAEEFDCKRVAPDKSLELTREG